MLGLVVDEKTFSHYSYSWHVRMLAKFFNGLYHKSQQIANLYDERLLNEAL